MASWLATAVWSALVVWSALAVWLLAASAAGAQPPSAGWRTLATEHFRFHYPEAAEVWTRRVASRMESVHTRVAAEIGYRPEGVTEVLVRDPLARPNGSAWPLLGRPRLVLYTSPPAADSVLGHFRDWGEVLTVHEDAHLVHLLRPSRNELRRLVESLVPVGPIPRAAPPWVVEGYATLVEGRLTGWGRPHSVLRSALLRRWAEAGALPSYGAMSGDGRRWLGLSLPYLIGSAYLEWLEERARPGALRDLWARMTAAETRSFDAAFRGVFGDSPARLYGRFCAELTYRAMALEQAIEPSLEIGELWQDLDWRPSAPALDLAGEHLAMVLRARGEPSRLVVWSTATDSEAEERFVKRRAALQERDPEDVAAVAPEAWPRQPIHVLEARNGAEPYSPRFGASGEWLLFHRFEVDEAGDLRPDLFRWWPESNQVERLTRWVDVRDADPASDGTWAVALRHRWGASQLVRVELAGPSSGTVSPLTEAEVETVYGPPRLDPSGRQIAYVVHRQQGWRLAVRPIDGPEALLEIEIAGTPPTHIAHPAWSADGREILVGLGVDGFLDLFAVEVASGKTRRLTRSQGAAMAPAPAPDGSVFFLALESDGFDLRRLAFQSVGPRPALAAAWPVEHWEDFVPAVPPRPEPGPEFEAVELPASSPYGAGPGEWLPLLGGAASRSAGRLEIGLRYGDPVGRLSVLALAASAEAGAQGAAVAASWRGWPVDLVGRLFALEERLAERNQVEADVNTEVNTEVNAAAVDVERRGLELALSKAYAGRIWGWRWRTGLLAAELERAGEDFDQLTLFGDAALRGRQRFGLWRLAESARFDLATGRTRVGAPDNEAEDAWSRRGFELRLEIGRQPVDGRGLFLGTSWRRAEILGARYAFDRLILGGTDDSLGPRSLTAARLYVPALPAGLRVGEHAESQRLELGVGSSAVLFAERHRLWNQDDPRGEWLRLAGLEWHFALAPLPLLALPGLQLEAGVAWLLDPPFEDDVEGWLVLRWSP